MEIEDLLDRGANIKQLAGMAQDLLKQIMDTWKKAVPLNILVLGTDEVEKTQMLTAIFGKKTMRALSGQNVSSHIRLFSTKNSPLYLYETVGLSDETFAQTKGEIQLFLQHGLENENGIHCIVYCTNGSMPEAHAEWIRSLIGAFGIPVLVVLLHEADALREPLLQEIELKPLNANAIVPLQLAPEPDPNELDDLIAAMADCLGAEEENREERRTFELMQTGSLRAKEKSAKKIILVNVWLAVAAVKVQQIPCADAVPLIGIQATMLARLTALFEVDLSKKALRSILSTAFGTALATFGGRFIASQLGEMIPGAGTVINTATAAAITGAMGKGYTKIMVMLYKGELTEKDLSTSEGKEQMRIAFKNSFEEGEPA